MFTPSRRVLVPLLAASLALGGCSDDEGGGAGDLAAFCELADVIGDVPDDDQVAQLRDTAPSAISQEVGVVLDALASGDFDSDEIIEAGVALESFIDGNCASDAGAMQEDAATASDPVQAAPASGTAPTDACSVDLALLEELRADTATPEPGIPEGSCDYKTADGAILLGTRIDTEALYTEEQFVGQIVEEEGTEAVTGVGDLAAFEMHGFGGVSLHVMLLDTAYVKLDDNQGALTADDLVALYNSMS